MTLTLFTLVSVAAAGPNGPLLDALQRAAPERTDVELVQWQAPASCARGDYEPARIDSSGRVPVRVRGASCEAWGWATVKLTTQALVLTKDVATGASVDGLYVPQRLEFRRGRPPLTTVDPDASATRPLRAGTMLTADVVRVGPPPGSTVTVRVLMGALMLEERGTISACSGDRVCASLPSGKRVEGRMVDGLLLVKGTP